MGLNLFDVAYADVIWGGANGNWGYTQQLLCWAIVATVWTLEAPICDPEKKPGELMKQQMGIWVCLKIGYIPNYSHLIGIMIINHWV